MKLKKSLAAIAATSLFASSVWATNGYAPHGIGQKSKGMGGVGIALVQDTVGGGMNPAGMVGLGNRLDVGLEWFRPIRSTEFVGNTMIDGFGLPSYYDGSDAKNFFIPEFGYNHMINERMALGVSVFGTGGMNTGYADGIPFFNQSGNATGIDLMQLFVVPSLSWKINDKHSIGIGLNLAAQLFSAEGLQNFDAPAGTGQQMSEAPGSVTNNGHDVSYGAGIRFGWIGQISDMVTLGATYQSRTYMSEFDDYKGLFAEQGDFDIPENFGVGIAIQATPKLLFAFDVMRINFSSVKAIGNSMSRLFLGDLLGSSNGPGFGWENQTAYKLGVSYELNSNWTLRGGWNHGDNPIPDSETFFNTLAPGVAEDHLTLGATWNLGNGQEITFTYMHAFENEVKGSASIPPNFGGGEADIKMYQNSIGISWGMVL
ncbi:OmpP1/FadL family transporter [Thiolapillus sp.]